MLKWTEIEEYEEENEQRFTFTNTSIFLSSYVKIYFTETMGYTQKRTIFAKSQHTVKMKYEQVSHSLELEIFR